MIDYKNLPPTYQDSNCKYWKVNGLLHREHDLPAQEFTCGDKIWLLNGKRHRIKNPAFIANTVCSWWRHGKRHRLNAPSLIWKGGYIQYWQFGIQIK